MAEAFLTSDLAVAILSKLASLAAEELVRVWRLTDDLHALKRRMELVSGLLSDAETKDIGSSSVQSWLRQLGDVARDADVLLDEFRYRALRQQVEHHSKVRKYLSFCSRFKMASKIKEINASLDGICNEGSKIGLKAVEFVDSVKAASKAIRPAGPFVDESQIFGRDDEINILVKELCCSYGEKDLRIIAIVGMGGSGKTSLAKMVYNNNHVNDHFGKRFWITISEDFDLVRILNEMVQSLTGKNFRLSNPEALIMKINEKLDSKKFLLVLDDVWNQYQSKWTELQDSLMGINVRTGNAIMITTRKSNVATIMGSYFIYHLKKLSLQDGWELFKQKAFANGEEAANERFVAIGKRMVEKCDGLPLAIKILGGLCFKGSEDEWLSIEKDPSWGLKEVLPSLRMSFDRLPSLSLKRCFTYCSFFPKDFEIKKEELIWFWMAFDLLHDLEGFSSMETKGECYFNTMLWNSLFEDARMDRLKNIVSCKMHDLVHDLALHVSKARCSTIQNDMVSFLPGNLSAGQLKVWKQLRVLVLSGKDVVNLPSSIGGLIHLRYIDIVKTGIMTLPDSISELYLLQTLRIRCLSELPKGFEKLVSLRHLYFEEVEKSLGCMFIGIRQIACLQFLPFFVVCHARGCLIEELGDLDDLSSELTIYVENVKILDDARKANMDKKSKIQSLRFYWPRTNNDDGQNDKDVLEGLKPHANIKQLCIENFLGNCFASWMVMLHNLVKVKLVNCHRCDQLPVLGNLPRLEVVKILGMDNLKCIGMEFYGFGNCINLNITSGDNSVGAGGLFPALRKLHLVSLNNLEEWMEAGEVGGPLRLNIFPCLEELVMEDCPVLKRIPGHFPSLKKLSISDLNDSMALEKMSSGLSSLSELELRTIGGPKTELVLEQLLRRNSSLRYVGIGRCWELKKLPTDCLQSCTSLTSLRLLDCDSLNSVPNLQCLTMLSHLSLGRFCPELDEFPWPYPGPSLSSLFLAGWGKLKSLPHQLHHLSPSLTGLSIVGFGELESLLEWLGNLSNLRDLCIWNCLKLRSFPSPEAMRRLSNLEYLFIIDGCPVVEEGCRERNGLVWASISHIPHIRLNSVLVRKDERLR